MSFFNPMDDLARSKSGLNSMDYMKSQVAPSLFAEEQKTKADADAAATQQYQPNPLAFQLGNPNTRQWLDYQINPQAQGMLFDAAHGNAPSAAQIQMQAGLERAQAMTQGMAASNPNISPALAQRMAGNQMTDMALQMNQQAMAQRAAEMEQARQLLAQYLTNQSGMGVDLAKTQLGAYMGGEGMRADMFNAMQDRALQKYGIDKNVQLQRQLNDKSFLEKYGGPLIGAAGTVAAYGAFGPAAPAAAAAAAPVAQSFRV